MIIFLILVYTLYILYDSTIEAGTYNSLFKLVMVSEFTNIVCMACIDNGSNWLYSTVDKIHIMSAKIMYFTNYFSIFSDTFTFLTFYNWFNSLLVSDTQLFYSIILDSFNELFFFKLPFLDEWYKNIFNTMFNNSLYIEHPEFVFIYSSIINTTYNTYLGSLYVSLYSNSIFESFNFIVFTIIHYYIFLLSLVLIFVLYFSSYINLTDEITVDLDYSGTNFLIEAEKEISSIDDTILFSVCILYLFGWFFYLNVFTFFSTRVYTSSILIILPFFFFTILGMPSLLIYDFGLYFLVYLRGAGTTSLFLFELMYDYIAVMVFYTRIVVQNIRLLLMFFTLINLYDVFLFFSLSTENFFKSLTIHEIYNVDYLTELTTSYSFFFNILNKIMVLIYEILHTYFIVMVQFIAFFAIVFWLFLFLYTFFVIEKQENYFTTKRNERFLMFERIKSLKI